MTAVIKLSKEEEYCKVMCKPLRKVVLSVTSCFLHETLVLDVCCQLTLNT